MPKVGFEEGGFGEISERDKAVAEVVAEGDDQSLRRRETRPKRPPDRPRISKENPLKAVFCCRPSQVVDLEVVARPGFEPGTRAFSVRCSTN